MMTDCSFRFLQMSFVAGWTIQEDASTRLANNINSSRFENFWIKIGVKLLWLKKNIWLAFLSPCLFSVPTTQFFLAKALVFLLQSPPPLVVSAFSSHKAPVTLDSSTGVLPSRVLRWFIFFFCLFRKHNCCSSSPDLKDTFPLLDSHFDRWIF